MFLGLVQRPLVRLLLLRHALRRDSLNLNGAGDQQVTKGNRDINLFGMALERISDVEDVFMFSPTRSAGYMLAQKEEDFLITLFSEVLLLAETQFWDVSVSTWLMSQIPWLVGFGIYFDLASLRRFSTVQLHTTPDQLLHHARVSVIFLGWLSTCIGHVESTQRRHKSSIPISSHSNFLPKSHHGVLWSTRFSQNLKTIETHQQLRGALRRLFNWHHIHYKPSKKHERQSKSASFIKASVIELLESCFREYQHRCSSLSSSQHQPKLASSETIAADLVVRVTESFLCLASKTNTIRSSKQLCWDKIQRHHFDSTADAKQSVLVEFCLNVAMAIWASAVMDSALSFSARRHLIELFSGFSSERCYNCEWKMKACLSLALYTRHLETLVYGPPVMQKIRPLFKFDPYIEV